MAIALLNYCRLLQKIKTNYTLMEGETRRDSILLVMVAPAQMVPPLLLWEDPLPMYRPLTV